MKKVLAILLILFVSVSMFGCAAAALSNDDAMPSQSEQAGAADNTVESPAASPSDSPSDSPADAPATTEAEPDIPAAADTPADPAPQEAVPSGSSADPVIWSVEYKGNGYVEVDFKGRVDYQDLAVTVEDAAGNEYTAEVWERDGDDLDFSVQNITPDQTYTFTITGIKNRSENAYTSVSETFTVPPADALAIRHVEYDAEDNELSIEFSQRVFYDNPNVEVKDAAGNIYECRVGEREGDDLEARVRGLQYGEEYTVTVSGVGNRDGNTVTTVSYTFNAWDD